MVIQFVCRVSFGIGILNLFSFVDIPHRFPVNMVVAKLSQKYEDRELIVATLIAMLVSPLGIIDYLPSHYSVYQYIIFGVGIFVSANRTAYATTCGGTEKSMWNRYDK